jgi:hypothetical protein
MDDMVGANRSMPYEAKGRTFESCRTHFNINNLRLSLDSLFLFVRPAWRDHLEVKVLYEPDRGNR